LNLAGRTVVIIGGGKVAARKARGVLEAGAGRVICVAPAMCEQIPPQVQGILEPYRAEHLDGATIVFAATDQADVNDAVVRDAHARNLLVSRADSDDQEPGDFSVPAVLRAGELMLTVSASSPALSATIRDRLADRLDPRWQSMSDAMRELRPMIKSSELSIDERSSIFRELADDAALDVLQKGGVAALRQWLLERHPELNHA
jgi:precorrin-2 dehydrogenase/sirohydrochlorin ferrochelatase